MYLVLNTYSTGQGEHPSPAIVPLDDAYIARLLEVREAIGVLRHTYGAVEEIVLWDSRVIFVQHGDEEEMLCMVSMNSRPVGENLGCDDGAFITDLPDLEWANVDVEQVAVGTHNFTWRAQWNNTMIEAWVDIDFLRQIMEEVG